MSEEQGQASKAVIDSDVADSNPEEVDPAGSSSTQKRKLEVKSLLINVNIDFKPQTNSNIKEYRYILLTIDSWQFEELPNYVKFLLWKVSKMIQQKN